MRKQEGELEDAMRKAEAGGSGGPGGDSRALAAQKVQQLVQKRSELVEMMTNIGKSLYESATAVNRNLK